MQGYRSNLSVAWGDVVSGRRALPPLISFRLQRVRLRCGVWVGRRQVTGCGDGTGMRRLSVLTWNDGGSRRDGLELWPSTGSGDRTGTGSPTRVSAGSGGATEGARGRSARLLPLAMAACVRDAWLWQVGSLSPARSRTRFTMTPRSVRSSTRRMLNRWFALRLDVTGIAARFPVTPTQTVGRVPCVPLLCGGLFRCGPPAVTLVRKVRLRFLTVERPDRFVKTRAGRSCLFGARDGAILAG